MKKFTKIAIIIAAIMITIAAANPVTANAATKKAAKLNKKSVTLTITDKKTSPTVTLKVKNVNGKSVKWTTSNKKVATVKKTGTYKVKVTAKKAGKVTITCKVNGR